MLAIVENHWRDAHFDAFQEGSLPFTAILANYKIYPLTIRNNMDVLTGLSGRRVLDGSFDYWLRNAEPLNLYLMLLDIDRFKLANGTYGHLIDDVALRTLTIYLASWTCDYETVYRYGDEGFITIVRAANDEETYRAGVRVYQLVDNHTITHFGGHINTTVTADVSRAFPEEPLDVATGRTDRVVYEDK